MIFLPLPLGKLHLPLFQISGIINFLEYRFSFYISSINFRIVNSISVHSDSYLILFYTTKSRPTGTYPTATNFWIPPAACFRRCLTPWKCEPRVFVSQAAAHTTKVPETADCLSTKLFPVLISENKYIHFSRKFSHEVIFRHLISTISNFINNFYLISDYSELYPPQTLYAPFLN